MMVVVDEEGGADWALLLLKPGPSFKRSVGGGAVGPGFSGGEGVGTSMSAAVVAVVADGLPDGMADIRKVAWRKGRDEEGTVKKQTAILQAHSKGRPSG
eukprot:CAMPEP_0184675276 /NCGR_PEP_ID=MMETSP0308-20130426/87700_1 /TAXON_ID=38269 /ORGANISM="Gloeochaete witrockiana, Strain SAG 46.84" /LENGTH=98 /DNA_ID=CAMNT_0027122967 /DNA_START=1337 /DNA_END=1634 /DNA_ORIENTATION=+